ncbi:hypothetical protein CEUSTIGMA_g12105.t1 [Chlamydomonas eustigma]|uniref:Peptidase M14 domain-containing protein n=1 Tax=Chlamydomonas eustigma TaxID=1157962 RepID=A0A250XNL5_9CHLO|nr:hypothetical protein CEUSTIGMA_g12105.t1 [Chlamydomonas eustigma]|eukprot:GAX84684.1 hypothetical protein CEUSTIGMA_g12105.t1 [Chlamydomonas eustigma]
MKSGMKPHGVGYKQITLMILKKISKGFTLHKGITIQTRAKTNTGMEQQTTLSVQSNFDSGNIEVVSIGEEGDIHLKIRPDPWCETDQANHMQWFHYRVRGVRGKSLKMSIINAGHASYPTEGWDGYHACASYDLEHWFRIKTTTYDHHTGVLSIQHNPESDSVHYAYFAPYTQERHAAFVHKLQTAHMASGHGVRLRSLGRTLEGRDIDLITVGGDAMPTEVEKHVIWIIGRQHPGETQAEYFIEGLLERLVLKPDAVARKLLSGAIFHVVPNMCPDGSYRGHLRTNAAGVNLNRAWAGPDPSTCPEVYHTLNRMKETGVDFLLDVHGDEGLPHCFVAGLSGIPRWNSRIEGLQSEFCDAFMRACPEFQTTYGYPRDAPGKANLNLCSKQIGQAFDCLSLTLEMPFKDCAELPEPLQEWSPERSKALGAGVLHAILETLPKLRY